MSNKGNFGNSDKEFLRSKAIPEDEKSMVELEEVLNPEQRILAKLKSSFILHTEDNLVVELKNLHVMLYNLFLRSEVLKENTDYNLILWFVAKNNFALILEFVLDKYKDILVAVDTQNQKYFSQNPGASLPTEKTDKIRVLEEIITRAIVNAFIVANDKMKKAMIDTKIEQATLAKNIMQVILAKLDNCGPQFKQLVINNLLYKISRKGGDFAVQELLEHKADPNDFSRTILCMTTRRSTTKYAIDEAAENGHTQIVKLLLLHTPGTLPLRNSLYYANDNRHFQIWKMLLEYKQGIMPKKPNILGVVSKTANSPAETVASQVSTSNQHQPSNATFRHLSL